MGVLSRSRLLLVVLGAVVATACGVDEALLLVPDPTTPQEARPGIFRLTFHRQPDRYPVWLDSVTIAYRSRAFAPFDTGTLLLARSIRGGPSAELVARLKRQTRPTGAIPIGMSRAASAQYFTTWADARNDVVLCARPCPGMAASGVSVYLVTDPATDSLPLLPRWEAAVGGVRRTTISQIPVVDEVTARITPADADAAVSGMNPYGPAISASGAVVFLSNGDLIFRALGGGGLDTVTTGAYPALSGDGSLLAFTRVTVSDSTTETCRILAGLGECRQQTRTFTETTREVWLRDLATGAERLLVAGEQPAFEPGGASVIVVTAGGLTRVELATGAATPIPNTAGAHSPAVSADGRHLAFVAEWAGQADVYFVALPRP